VHRLGAQQRDEAFIGVKAAQRVEWQGAQITFICFESTCLRRAEASASREGISDGLISAHPGLPSLRTAAGPDISVLQGQLVAGAVPPPEA
jgi:hypothetical protein